MPTGADQREDMRADAEGRRNLQGRNKFTDLGKPIQDILLKLEEEGDFTDDKTLDLLKHVPVKALAKVFDMLSEGKDPETILAWLKRRARRSKKKSDKNVDELKEKIQTGATRDPIAFFKEFEKENQKRIEEEQQAQEDRDKLRAAKCNEREKKRKEQQQAMEDAKKAMAEDGQDFNATDAMDNKARNAIAAAFEKFANDASGFDNSNNDQDGEWWKKDPYRRDWERNKAKGKKWTAVIEGGKEPATDAEQAVREEYYKSNDWWKADKYKQDWEATKDNEWWKEEPYIQDWQQNKLDGTRWKAATEEAGLEGEGTQYPAPPDELKRREEWYKANGPRGVVKRWNAATEGDIEKCSVPEKLDREEYYRDGDWWKGDPARLDFRDKGLAANALKFAKEEDAKDKEWWKQEPYREDFWGKGDDGKKWNALNEEAGIDGASDKSPAPELEKKKREDWYKDNWWKQKKHADDWKKGGKCWKAPNQKQADSGAPEKSVGPEEQKKREEWYKEKMPDMEWWKAPEMIEDYHQHGPQGRHWGAKTQGAGLAGKAQESPATPEEQQKRADWYKDNWWKQPKYVEEWAKNPAAAAAPGSAAWTCKNDEPGKDKEWWKQPEFIKDWQESQAPTTKGAPADWWKQPEYVEDFQRHGDKGSKWTAAGESDGIAGKGGSKPASDPEKQRRADWYKDNWWRAPQYAIDWANKGPKGEKWKAATKDAADDPAVGATNQPCSPDERRERENFFSPQGEAWRAVGEPEGYEKKAKEFPCSPKEALKRDEWFRNNWWKAPEYAEDWKKNGPDGKKWVAGCESAGKDGTGDKDPCTDPEKRERENWYKVQGDIEWWKEPALIEDWARNGDQGAMWPADNRVNAAKYGGREHPADPEEKAKREQWYKDNWWKTPQAMDDWKKRGKDGDHWSRKAAPQVQDRDPETEGDGWWKQPAFIEDWLKHPEDGKCWIAADPEAGATGQGKKKPATDPEKAKRAKWYMDNWWKAPSCTDDWNKNGAKGKDWLAKDPVATRLHEGDKDPVNPDEQKKREDWYKARGDKDEWWKRPEFVEDYQDNGDKGKGWVAANPTAGALGQGQECPASAPEREKREQWYKDNWWKHPKYAQAWKKGATDWAKEAPGALKEAQGPEKKKRDDWFKQNAGEPASDDEKAKREDWYKKHAGEQNPQALAKREEWLRKQLPDASKAKRMAWLKERAANDKRILAEELPDALAAINEGQKPTDEQVQEVMDHIKKNRDAARDDWMREGQEKPDGEPEEETVGQDEFLQAVADTNFYVAPDKEEREMQEEEEIAAQISAQKAREEEELAFLAMEKEDDNKKTPEEWQRKAKVDVKGADDWWKQPEFIENFQKNPEPDAANAHWAKDPHTKQPVDPEEQAARQAWYKKNWWKSPEYSQQWRRAADGDDDGAGDGWKKNAKPDPEDPDADEDAPRPEEGMEEATPEEIEEREKWYKNARAPERTYEDPTASADEWWKKPEVIEAYQDGKEDWKKQAQEGEPEVTPEEQEKREQWFKDNWWKAPKHVEEWKKRADEDPATSSWTKTAPPAEEEAEAEPEVKATPEEIQEREAWYKAATEVPPPQPVAAPRSTGWGKQAGDPPFVGEKFFDPIAAKKTGWGKQIAEPEPQPDDPPKEEAPPPPAQTEDWVKERPFTGEKFFDPEIKPPTPEPEPEEDDEEEPFIGEKFYEREAIPSMEGFTGEKVADEEIEEEEPFIGEKFYGQERAAPVLPTGEKFENEDDKEEDEEEEPFEGEKFYDKMKEEDPREDDDGDAEFLQEQQDEDAAWAEGADSDDDEEGEPDDDDEEESDDGEDNEHQDDEDLEKELEAAYEEGEEGWEHDEEEEED
eukprot:Hpha_TRINITY_DN15322_c2_g6::TRINITY_DN15322_c2_g6_i2::g.91525::m.91525